MGKRIIAWPTSPIDLIVEQWAIRHGIDMRRDVMGYDLHRGPGDLPTITLWMLFDDEPVPEVTGLDETVPTYIPPEADDKE